jgi:formamidopyrimidine-DNA glycosylase
MSDRDDAPSWWKSQDSPQLEGPELEAAMRKVFNSCTKGVTPGGILLSELDDAAQKVVYKLFPQDTTAASSVLGDTCPRCGGQLEQHEGLERDYPSCPACR